MEGGCPLSAYRVLTHHGDASGCYIQDFLVSRDHEVTPYHLDSRWSYVAAPAGTMPRFVVVEASAREIASISCRKPVTVVDLVLADGEGTLFRAATGLGLSWTVSQFRVESGMSIVVQQKNIILLNDNPLDPSLFMVIHRMALREQPNLDNPPPKQAKAEWELALQDYQKDHFTDPVSPHSKRFPALTVDCYPKESVKKVMNSGRVVFMSVADLPQDLQDRRGDFSAVPNVFAESDNSSVMNGTWGLDRGERNSCSWKDLVSYHARPDGKQWYSDRERIHYGNSCITQCPCKGQHVCLPVLLSSPRQGRFPKPISSVRPSTTSTGLFHPIVHHSTLLALAPSRHFTAGGIQSTCLVRLESHPNHPAVLSARWCGIAPLQATRTLSG